MTRPRVVLIGDYVEERWPSMDLVFDSLLERLSGDSRFSVEGVRPPLPRRFSAQDAYTGRGYTADRFAGRFVEYPRFLRNVAPADVYHIVDHSYAHLARVLPVGRTVVTCHDADAFRALFDPAERRSRAFRTMAAHVLRGLQRAAVVTCDSEATREELVFHHLVPEEKTITIPLGVDPIFSGSSDDGGDPEALRQVPEGAFVLHVGSTIPRKRVDVLLRAFAIASAVRPSLRLVRAGGAFTADQESMLRSHGLTDRVTVMPFLERSTLASIYRQAAAVLLTSDREGFGFPVVEALASGTPVIASDLPVLREAGGDYALYARPGDPQDFAAKLLEVLARRERPRPLIRFTWDDAARRMAALYLELVSRSGI